MRVRLPMFLVALALSLSFGTARVEAKAQPRPSDLTETYDTVDRMCGEVGSPATQAAACAERDKLYALIKARGWCKGRIGQAPADGTWHECGSKSR